MRIHKKDIRKAKRCPVCDAVLCVTVSGHIACLEWLHTKLIPADCVQRRIQQRAYRLETIRDSLPLSAKRKVPKRPARYLVEGKKGLWRRVSRTYCVNHGGVKVKVEEADYISVFWVTKDDAAE